MGAPKSLALLVEFDRKAGRCCWAWAGAILLAPKENYPAERSDYRPEDASRLDVDSLRYFIELSYFAQDTVVLWSPACLSLRSLLLSSSLWSRPPFFLLTSLKRVRHVKFTWKNRELQHPRFVTTNDSAWRMQSPFSTPLTFREEWVGWWSEVNWYDGCRQVSIDYKVVSSLSVVEQQESPHVPEAPKIDLTFSQMYLLSTQNTFSWSKLSLLFLNSPIPCELPLFPVVLWAGIRQICVVRCFL